jgi:hypothetical protein
MKYKRIMGKRVLLVWVSLFVGCQSLTMQSGRANTTIEKAAPCPIDNIETCNGAGS